MTEVDDLNLAAMKRDEPVSASAYHFLRAGGSLGLSDWLALSGESAAALVAAGDRLRVEQALRIGKACSSQLGAAHVASEVDGGAALETVAVEEFVGRIEQGLHGVR